MSGEDGAVWVEGEDPWAGMVDDNNFPLDEAMPADQSDYVAAVEKARTEMGGGRPDEDAPEWIRERFASVDWGAAYQTDFSRVDWLPGRFMERGQQVTLVGDGKVGKSLFALDWAFRMVAGRSFLGDDRRTPLRVLYLDRENSLRDVVTRAKALGARPRDLAALVYKQFPGFTGTLDQSKQAAWQLAQLVEHERPDVVVVDTVSRFIGGKENDSDTWLQLYQMIHAPLKKLGIACVRLDHFGKDAERGSRGSSAKSQDVDAVWELSKLNQSRADVPDHDVESIVTTMRLTRTYTRSGLGEDQFAITRRGERRRGGMWLDGRTRHEVTDTSVLGDVRRQVDVIVDELIAAGVPRGAGRDAIKGWLRQNGRPTFGNTVMADVVRELKSRPE